MPQTLVAKSPARARVRLNLAPRLKEDESLSSWLERFAGAYGLTLGEFMRWLGYRAPFSYGQALLDLDADPPPDLSNVLEQHTGIPARVFEQHRLIHLAALPSHLRRAFCPQCWTEDGPYRRRQWANAWSLVCMRHRRFLREKPRPELPLVRNAEESWLEYYHTPRLWADGLRAWEDPSWVRICDALGVKPRTEFLLAYRWLQELQRISQTFGPGDRQETMTSATDLPARTGAKRDSECAEWVVRRDLVVYGVLRFHEPSILEALEPAIEPSRLVQSGHRPDMCGIVSPEADYYVRLLAATTARHLWNRLTGGQWRCRETGKLEVTLGNPERWNDQDWWLERHLQYWPQVLQQAGRKLFRKNAGWTQTPPWSACRDYCVRQLPRSDRGVLVPTHGWRCLWAMTEGRHELIVEPRQ